MPPSLHKPPVRVSSAVFAPHAPAASPPCARREAREPPGHPLQVMAADEEKVAQERREEREATQKLRQAEREARSDARQAERESRQAEREKRGGGGRNRESGLHQKLMAISGIKQGARIPTVKLEAHMAGGWGAFVTPVGSRVEVRRPEEGSSAPNPNPSPNPSPDPNPPR